MRYDTRLLFRKTVKGSYNELTGNYEDDYRKETAVRANVTRIDISRAKKMFGDISQASLTARLLRPYTDAYDDIVIEGRTYKTERSYAYRNGQVLILSEVPGGTP